VETPSCRAAQPSCVFCRIAAGDEQPSGNANRLLYKV
jgi:hypothetical protein